MSDLFWVMNPLKWWSFQLALLEVSWAICGSLMRTHFSED